MLRAYFDDAGTHTSSDVVVLAGLIGSLPQWEQFERRWAAKLQHPLDGKPPLKLFHLSACNARVGQFRSYSDAEQDAVIHDFRQVIIDSRLTSIATAVDKRAWDELIVGPIRDVLDGALIASMRSCGSSSLTSTGTRSPCALTRGSRLPGCDTSDNCSCAH